MWCLVRELYVDFFRADLFKVDFFRVELGSIITCRRKAVVNCLFRIFEWLGMLLSVML